MSDPVELFRVRFDQLMEEIKRGICLEVDTKASALFALLQEELLRQLSTDDQKNMVVTGDDPNESDEIVFCRFQVDEADSVSVKSECDCDSAQDEEYDVKEEPEVEEDREEAGDGDDNENNQDEADDHVSRENAEDNVDADSESDDDLDDAEYSFEESESDSTSVKSESDSECDTDSEQDDDIEEKEELIDGDQEGTEELVNPSGTDQVTPIASTSSGRRRSSHKSVKRKDISPDDTATSDDDDSDRGEAGRQRKSARIDPTAAVRTEASHEDTSGYGDSKQVITRYFNCTVTGCVKKCKDKAKLKKHLKSQHGVFLDRCHVRGCQATFPNQYQIGDHLRSAHSTLTSWPCDICTVQCPSYHSLTIHAWHNHEQGHFACGYTGCIFTSHISRAKVIDHLYHHKPATYFCTFTGCGKVFKKSSHLKNHLVTHTGVKAFRCVTCNIAFTQKSNLTVHLKNQTHRRNAERAAAN